MKIAHWPLLTLVVLLKVVLATPAFATQPPAFLPPYVTQKATVVEDQKRFLISLGLISGFSFGKMVGGSITGGYQLDRVGFDLRISYVSSQFGEFFPTPGADDQSGAASGTASAEDSGTELQRGRTFKDSWSFLVFQPGITYRAKLFAWDLLPELSQFARVGIGFGPFTDSVNSFSFSSVMVNTTAGFDYRFKPQSPWTGNLGLEYAWGVLSRSNPSANGQEGRMPIRYLSFVLSTSYWF